MKKGQFTMTMIEPDGSRTEETATGWYNDQYGVRKVKEKRHTMVKCYQITHLKSGGLIPSDFIYLKHAKELADRLNAATFPVPMESDERVKNLPKMKEIFQAMEKEIQATGEYHYIPGYNLQIYHSM